MKLTRRDSLIIEILTNNAYSLSQIAIIYFNSNTKKGAERMKVLFDAGIVFRTQRPFVSGRGKAEYVYSAKPIKNVFSIPHSLIISDLHVSMIRAEAPGYSVAFSYPNSIGLVPEITRGLVPDGIVVIKSLKTGKKLLHFIEADTGSESITSKRAHYSVDRKFNKYVELYDNKDNQSELEQVLGFKMKGFRVLVIASSGKRIRAFKALTSKTNAEFVWFALHEDVNDESVFGPIWSNYKYDKLSLIGRYPPGNLVGD